MARVWESDSLPAKFVRAALLPPAMAYAAAVRLRNTAYDRGWLRSHALALPSISVGNLTVGGTGKTPVAAYIAARLAKRGLKPAIVMRGYGDDETLVHARLNPDIPVVIAADRVRGVIEAREMGCGIAVLDDAFQHRRAKRDADVVLLAAEAPLAPRPLPMGPWREPLWSLARATLIVVTRKSAPAAAAAELLARARAFAPRAGGAIVHLSGSGLVDWLSGKSLDLSALRGKSVLAVAAIGAPRAFAAQLAKAGARVELAAQPDHHRYTAADAAALAGRAASFDMVVCTLKDAVKLGPVWPREAPPLWYLSQRVVVESGASDLDRVLAALAVRNSDNR